MTVKKRSLGRHDLRLCELALGTWGLAEQSYGEVDAVRFDATLEAALDNGITTFDVAPLWGDGEAERRVGEAIRSAGGEATVITRGGARYHEGELEHGFEPRALRHDCEGSLERLGVEQVDLWLLHDPPEEALRESGWRETVERMVEEGLVRCWGASVGDVERARLAIAAGAQAICVTHNLLDVEVLRDLAPDLAESGVGVLARSPLCYGMLGGHWSESRRFPENDHRRRRWTGASFRERLKQVEELRFLTHADVPTLAEAALRFVLGTPRVTCALVGARTPYQVSAAVKATEGGPPYLDPEDLTRLAKVRDAARI